MNKTIAIKTIQVILFIITATVLFCWTNSSNAIFEMYSQPKKMISTPPDSILSTSENKVDLENYPNLKISDFEHLFPPNGSYLIDVEKKQTDFDMVQFLRLRHLKSFCDKQLIKNFTTDGVKSITLFTPYHYYECRVPKTGKNTDDLEFKLDLIS